MYTVSHKLGGNGGSGLTNQLLQLQKKPNAISAALAPLWQTVTGNEAEKKQMSKEDLLKYAKEAFQIDDQTHQKLMEQVKEEKVSNMAMP